MRDGAVRKFHCESVVILHCSHNVLSCRPLVLRSNRASDIGTGGQLLLFAGECFVEGVHHHAARSQMKFFGIFIGVFDEDLL